MEPKLDVAPIATWSCGHTMHPSSEATLSGQSGSEADREDRVAFETLFHWQ